MKWTRCKYGIGLLWLVPLALMSQSDPYYQLEVDTLPYQALAQGELVWAEALLPLSPRQVIAVPFAFAYFGRTVPNMEPSLQGSLHLGSPGDSFYPFKPQLVPRSFSQLCYQVEGEACCRDRILKVEWHRFGLACDSLARYEISFQIWLHEGSGTLTLHHGPQQAPPDFEAWAAAQSCYMFSPGTSNSWPVGSQYGLLLNYPGWEATIYLDGGELRYVEGNAADLAVSAHANLLAPFPPDRVLRFRPDDLPASPDELSAFPNSFDDALYVQRLSGCEELRFALHDQFGRWLADFTYQGPGFLLPTAHLSAGMYFLRATRPDGSLVQHWKLWKR